MYINGLLIVVDGELDSSSTQIVYSSPPTITAEALVAFDIGPYYAACEHFSSTAAFSSTCNPFVTSSTKDSCPRSFEKTLWTRCWSSATAGWGI